MKILQPCWSRKSIVLWDGLLISFERSVHLVCHCASSKIDCLCITNLSLYLIFESQMPSPLGVLQRQVMLAFPNQNRVSNAHIPIPLPCIYRRKNPFVMAQAQDSALEYIVPDRNEKFRTSKTAFGHIFSTLACRARCRCGGSL